MVIPWSTAAFLLPDIQGILAKKRKAKEVGWLRLAGGDKNSFQVYPLKFLPARHSSPPGAWVLLWLVALVAELLSEVGFLGSVVVGFKFDVDEDQCEGDSDVPDAGEAGYGFDVVDSDLGKG